MKALDGPRCSVGDDAGRGPRPELEVLSSVPTAPGDFVAACASGIEWRDVTVLGAIYGPDDAAIVYEGVNVTDEVRVRTAEYLVLDGDVIREAVAVIAEVGTTT